MANPPPAEEIEMSSLLSGDRRCRKKDEVSKSPPKSPRLRDRATSRRAPRHPVFSWRCTFLAFALSLCVAGLLAIRRFGSPTADSLEEEYRKEGDEFPGHANERTEIRSDFATEYAHIRPDFLGVVIDERRPWTLPSEKLYDLYSPAEVRNVSFWSGLVEAGAGKAYEDGATDSVAQWGPCYGGGEADNVDWNGAILQNEAKAGKDAAVHIDYPKSGKSKDAEVAGKCRPGFLIIGAGKCGTSSLYHYLTGHPRALLATEKQIHYFKYYLYRGMGWYLNHFPTTEFFLSSGALITGEASPGYLPYPDVAYKIKKTLPDAKILMMAREPLDRAWSSYNYNYVQPALKMLRIGRKGIPAGRSEEYYRKYHIFSFEELVRAELDMLAECLRPGGRAEIFSKQNYKWAQPEVKRRKKLGLPPLVALHYSCYSGKRISASVPAAQWSALVAANPNKFLAVPNTMVVQALVGRGLYALQAEWYYVADARGDGIVMVCSEDLRERPLEALNNVTASLGLPAFNYSDVVEKGMYNVAEHTGYDTATPWSHKEGGREGGHDTVEEGAHESKIPLSPGTLKELKDMFNDHNSRLFHLVGHRCNW